MTPNLGQWDDRINYAVDLDLGKLYLQKGGMSFFLSDFMAHDDEHDHKHDEIQRAHFIQQKLFNPSKMKSLPRCI